MPTGVVKWFDVEGPGSSGSARREGRIRPLQRIQGDGFRVGAGETVEYDLADSERGPQAKNVRRPSSSDSPEPTSPTT